MFDLVTEPRKHPKRFPEKTLQFSDEDCSEGCYCRRDLNDIQIQVDDDFISLNIEDYDSLNQIEVTRMSVDKHAQRKKRRKRKKHRKKNNNNRLRVASMAVQMKMNDHLKDLDEDELSKRARLTIILTACLLLFMCLLLVGITLRMAPLIDDMGKTSCRKFNKILD